MRTPPYQTYVYVVVAFRPRHHKCSVCRANECVYSTTPLVLLLARRVSPASARVRDNLQCSSCAANCLVRTVAQDAANDTMRGHTRNVIVMCGVKVAVALMGQQHSIVQQQQKRSGYVDTQL